MKALQKALERKQKNLSYKVLILAQSKGAREPVDTNETEKGRAQNRRVEIFISTKKLQPKRFPAQRPPDVGPRCNDTLLQALFSKCDADFNDCRSVGKKIFADALLKCGSDRECHNRVYKAARRFYSECISAIKRCQQKAKYRACGVS
jgi:hypothetical protein